MNKSMKQLLLIMAVLGLSVNLSAQNLDKMPQKQRDSVLLVKAKATVLKHGPDYYRDYGRPEIKHEHISDKFQTQIREIYIKNHPGRSFYTVTFLYDKSEEDFPWKYSSKVYIWGDTGVVFQIDFGNGLGFGQLDMPQTKSGSSEEQVMKWKKAPPGAFDPNKGKGPARFPEEDTLTAPKKK